MKAFNSLRRYFLRGLAALLPTILTIWIFVQFYQFVRDSVSSRINESLVSVLVYATDWYPDVETEDLLEAARRLSSRRLSEDELARRIEDPDVMRAARREVARDFWVRGWGQVAGFLIALVAVLFVGALLVSVVGHSIWRTLEGLLMRTPLVKKVYPYLKQITDFLFAQERMAIEQVVAVQYPRSGVWSIGLVTGHGLKAVASRMPGIELVTVFMPTSPTPFTGVVIMLPRDEVLDVGMSVEEGLRFVVSGGVITPSTPLGERLHKPSSPGNRA